jgi:hypothetical protein
MMKMNKWTMALAAAGVVSLSSVTQAQEAAAGAEALAASTTLSGYVSSSYTAGDGDSPPGGLGKTNEDTDHFKLDVVSLTLASAQGAGEYATGYTVQFWAGPDDGASGSDSASLQQANIDLRLPFGNGIDLKVGKFGTIVGHEVFDYNQNAFFQRGLGFDMEPTHHTGILASYQATDDLAVQLGFANDTTTAETSTSADDGSSAYLAGLSYTLPDSMGFAAGTAITLATVRGASAVGTPEVDRDNTYLGVSLPSVVENLSIDFAADWGETGDNDDEIYQVYAGYALNDKATLNLRYEWGLSDNAPIPGGAFGVESLAIGLTYDLWENVTSRVEWMSTSVDNAGVADDNTLAFNLVYSF